LIVDLQDADKIGHTGSIPVFDPNRNLGIGRGPVPLPKPHEQISDVSHGVLSAANYGSRYQLLERQAPLDQEKGRRELRRRPRPATAGS
jgi:hypothetical protein